MRQQAIIIDDFYDDPRAIRQVALNLCFRRKTGATYPGREAVASGCDWELERSMLAKFIHEDVSGAGAKDPPFDQGKFRIATKTDEQTRLDGVHEDVQPWSGIVYLSLPEDCRNQAAVACYEHKDTGAREPTPKWWLYISLKLAFSEVSADERKSRYWAYMRDMDNWIELERFENKFNRAILLYARRFHASTGLFGTSNSDGRLTQHFEYYYPE